MAVDMTEIVPPKWWLATKRGWGMLITGVMAGLPLAAGLIYSWFGVNITPEMVSNVNTAVLDWIEATGTVIGVALWVYGSFRPTAPLTVGKPKERPVV